MIGKLAIAQFDLENALAELSRNGASTGPLEIQLQNLSVAMRQVGSAGPAALASLRSDVAAIVAQSGAVAQQARTSATSAQSADAAELASAVRDQVNAVMRGMKDFDPYLQFANAEAEADYRRREAERRAYIEEQQAKGTPEGDLNAAGAAMGQMADAGAHGAVASPEFDRRWNALADSTQRLRDQLVREGKDVSEFDNRLREDLRQIMRAKGKSDAEIDALLAAHPENPIEAAKTLVENETDLRTISRSVYRSSDEATPTMQKVAAPLSSEDEISAASAIAALQAAGVTADVTADQSVKHGVTANAVAKSGPSLA